MSNEGTVDFWLKHEHGNWATNDYGYDFGRFQTRELSISALKHPDRTIELEISGPFGQFNFRHPIPECDERGLYVAITWRDSEIQLYLNGQLVDTASDSLV